MVLRCWATAFLSFCFPHILLCKMKGNPVSVTKWKMLLRNRKQLRWCMVAKKGRARNESDFFCFSADLKLSI